MAKRPPILPTPSLEMPVRKNASSIYIDAGTGNTKVLVYRMSYWEGSPISFRTRVFAQDIDQLDPIVFYAKNDQLNELLCDITDASFDTFVDKAVLGATEWRRKHKPEDPYIEDFCSKLQVNGFEFVSLDAQLEAKFEAIAIRFALRMYSMYTKKELDCTYYVSAGGGSLQFGSIYDDVRFSFPIEVKVFSDRIWDQCRQGTVEFTEFDAHCKTLHQLFESKVNVKGTLLCMGSFFYSAKEIRMSNAPEEFNIFPVASVLDAMKICLGKYRVRLIYETSTMTKKEVRAYVALRVNSVFLDAISKHVRVLFKRDWKFEKNMLRTTWTFGHFFAKSLKMDLYVCFLWHPIENDIVKARLVPKHSVKWVLNMWGPNAQSSKAIHNLKQEDLNSSIVSLIYGKPKNVKVRLFKSYFHAQMAVNVLIRANNLEIITGFML
jgi:hypothetical protein